MFWIKYKSTRTDEWFYRCFGGDSYTYRDIVRTQYGGNVAKFLVEEEIIDTRCFGNNPIIEAEFVAPSKVPATVVKRELDKARSKAKALQIRITDLEELYDRRVH